MPRKTRKPQSLTFSGGPEPDEIQRIVPLGLTPQEARAWYRHNLMRTQIARACMLFIPGLGILAVLVMFRLLAVFLEARMPFHMVIQHLLFVLTGFVLAFGAGRVLSSASKGFEKASSAYDFLSAQNRRLNRWGIPAFMVAAMLVVYWNLPGNIMATVINDSVHLEMHLTLLAVGVLLSVGLGSIPSKIRYFAPVVGGKLLGLVGIFLLISRTALYSAYPISQQIESGTLMVVTMLAIDFTLVPYWLYHYFSAPSETKAHS